MSIEPRAAGTAGRAGRDVAQRDQVNQGGEGIAYAGPGGRLAGDLEPGDGDRGGDAQHASAAPPLTAINARLNRGSQLATHQAALVRVRVSGGANTWHGSRPLATVLAKSPSGTSFVSSIVAGPSGANGVALV